MRAIPEVSSLLWLTLERHDGPAAPPAPAPLAPAAPAAHPTGCHAGRGGDRARRMRARGPGHAAAGEGPADGQPDRGGADPTRPPGGGAGPRRRLPADHRLRAV